MKKLKVSFDFDGTLGEKKIQELATFFVNAGADVWILTARQEDAVFDENDVRIGHLGYNMDLRRIAAFVGIPEDKILFTNGALKKEMYFENDFDLHFDDLVDEVDAINNNGGNAMLVFASIMECTDQLQYIIK